MNKLWEKFRSKIKGRESTVIPLTIVIIMFPIIMTILVNVNRDTTVTNMPIVGGNCFIDDSYGRNAKQYLILEEQGVYVKTQDTEYVGHDDIGVDWRRRDSFTACYKPVVAGKNITKK